MNYTFIPKAILVLWGLTYFWRIFSPFTKKIELHFHCKNCFDVMGINLLCLSSIICLFLWWYLVDCLILIDLASPPFGGLFCCCKQLIFSCLLLVADFCFDILWFSFSIYFLLVKIFYQFSLFEKGEIPFPILSVFVFRKSTVLLLVMYPL